MNWIKTEDKLPNEKDNVLAITSNAPDTVVMRRFEDGKFWYNDDNRPYIAEVTHWMPLPEPPNS